MRNLKSLALALLCPLLLASCAKRTAVVTQTFYDNVFSFVAAGNMYLGEWDPIPEDYVDYKPFVRSYCYVLKHDGTASYEATYRRLDSEEWVSVSGTGTYSARAVGPKETISITLDDHSSTLVWEPNPREPWGKLVFRLCDVRDDTMLGTEVFITLLSQSISPHPM